MATNTYTGYQQPTHPGYQQPTTVVYSNVPQPAYQVSTAPVTNTVVYTNGTYVPDVGNAWTWSIITCLFCFWPLGLVAMLYASKANDAVRRGDYDCAEMNIRTSKKLSKISLITGIFIIVGITSFYLVLFLTY
eukprot:TRINITY_DN11921_c0_g1_i1.p1 TRINITY_DN11921_c0_g1~~TRINITY_DN11921_c0_g1_i1.p1  ORF type:complete len:133 (-),score=6.62 TRINITY_DN11921_c0_g1_i1:87-485(-)